MPAECRRRGVLRWKGIVKINGKQVASKWFGHGPKGGPEYKKALRWEDSTRASLPTDGQAPTPSVSWTILDWANEYLAFAQERNSLETFKEKRKAFKLLLQKLGADGKVEDITIPVAMNHLRSVKKATTGSTANSSRKNLAKAWEWGRKYLEHFPLAGNPFRAVDKFPVTRKPRYVPPEEDFRKVLEIAEGQDRVMLLALSHLAARRGEIFRMTWQDLDFKNSQVRLWTRKTADGSMRADWVPMTDQLKQAFLWWWENRPLPRDHVFYCVDIGDARSSDLYGQPFKHRYVFMEKVCRRAGVKPFGFHAIRHLTATVLYNLGYPVATIQAILRHQTPTTTNRYLHSLGMEQGLARQAVEALAQRSAAGGEKVVAFRKKEALEGVLSRA